MANIILPSWDNNIFKGKQKKWKEWQHGKGIGSSWKMISIKISIKKRKNQKLKPHFLCPIKTDEKKLYAQDVYVCVANHFLVSTIFFFFFYYYMNVHYQFFYIYNTFSKQYSIIELRTTATKTIINLTNP